MFSLFLSCRVVLVAVLVLVGSVSVNAFSMRRAPPNLPTDVNPDIIKGRTDVLCLGEVLFDCIANEDTCGLTVDEIVAKNKYQKYAGGAVANVACALSRLGVRSTFAGGIGNDADGRELMKMLDSLKVETMCSVNTSPTRRVMVTRNEQRDRTFNGFWNNKHSGTFADCDYQPAVSSKWFLESTTLAVVMGTLGLAAGNTALVMERIARDIKANRIQGKDASTPLLVIDMNVRDVFWPGIAPSVVKDTIVNFAKGADIIKLTDEVSR